MGAPALSRCISGRKFGHKLGPTPNRWVTRPHTLECFHREDNRNDNTHPIAIRAIQCSSQTHLRQFVQIIHKFCELRFLCSEYFHFENCRDGESPSQWNINYQSLWLFTHQLMFNCFSKKRSKVGTLWFWIQTIISPNWMWCVVFGVSTPTPPPTSYKSHPLGDNAFGVCVWGCTPPPPPPEHSNVKRVERGVVGGRLVEIRMSAPPVDSHLAQRLNIFKEWRSSVGCVPNNHETALDFALSNGHAAAANLLVAGRRPPEGSRSGTKVWKYGNVGGWDTSPDVVKSVSSKGKPKHGGMMRSAFSGIFSRHFPHFPAFSANFRNFLHNCIFRIFFARVHRFSRTIFACWFSLKHELTHIFFNPGSYAENNLSKILKWW